MKKVYIKLFLFYIIVLATFFPEFYIELFFAFKPYMFAMVCTAFFLLVYKLKINFKVYSYEGAFAIFIAYMCIRGAISYDIKSAFRMAVGFIIIILFYILVSSLAYALTNRQIINCLLICGSLFLIVSLLIYYDIIYLGIPGKEMDNGGLWRLQGTINDPNIFCMFDMIIIISSLYHLFHKKYLALIPLLLSLVSLQLSYSRGGYLGVIVAIVFFIMTKIRLTKISIASFCGIGSMLLLFKDYIFKLIEPYFMTSAIIQRFGDLGGSGRIQLWKNGISFFLENPIVGIGLYNFSSYNLRFYNHNNYMHNMYLDILVEGGLIGISLFGLSFILFIKHILSYKLRLSSESALAPAEREAEGIIVMMAILIGQFIMMSFLSGYIFESIFLVLAIQKGILMRRDANDYLY